MSLIGEFIDIDSKTGFEKPKPIIKKMIDPINIVIKDYNSALKGNTKKLREIFNMDLKRSTFTKRLILRNIIKNEHSEEQFDKRLKQKRNIGARIHKFIDKDNNDQRNIDRVFGINGIILLNDVNNNEKLNKQYVKLLQKKDEIKELSEIKKIKNDDDRFNELSNKLLFIGDLINFTEDVFKRQDQNRLKKFGTNSDKMSDSIAKIFLKELEPIKSEMLTLRSDELRKQGITKDIKIEALVDKLNEQVKVKENLTDENELFAEDNNKLEDKLKKAQEQGFTDKHNEDDVKITIDESKKSTEEMKPIIGRIDIKDVSVEEEEEEEEEEEQERRIIKIDERAQRQLLFNKISDNNQKTIAHLTNVGSQAIIGTGLVGLIGTLAPYVPKTLQAIRGVPMKKKHNKDDLILLHKTGIDRNEINNQKRTIDNLNRRLDNINLNNRERSINKITNIAQQNRFNRVAINNIRGRTVHVKNHIKMHNITKRKKFNI